VGVEQLRLRRIYMRSGIFRPWLLCCSVVDVNPLRRNALPWPTSSRSTGYTFSQNALASHPTPQVPASARAIRGQAELGVLTMSRSPPPSPSRPPCCWADSVCWHRSADAADQQPPMASLARVMADVPLIQRNFPRQAEVSPAPTPARFGAESWLQRPAHGQ